LGKHNWTPETIQHVLTLVAEMPYDRAARTVEMLTGIPLSHSSLHRLVQEYGGRLVEGQAAEAESMVKPPAKFDEETFRQVPEPDSELMAVSMDGAMIHLRDEGWKEVKTVAVSAVERVGRTDSASTQPEPKVKLTNHSYRAGLWEAATFANQQWAETTRRGIEKAKQIVSVNDGAVWIWVIVKMCYAPCIEILDWWHALQKLWQIGSLLFGEGNALGPAWFERHKAHLWSGNLRPIFQYVHTRYSPGEAWPDGLAQALGYFFNNRHRMRYAKFRRDGYPVGSGTVESACKVVVEARMKQAGMRWSRGGAQAMLALRSTILSNRWGDNGPSLGSRSKAA
jgi:hypothetical protein